jgi:predicted transposase/invertase (TIGR01784 family)
MQSGIDPKVDYVFKRVFASEDNSAPLIDLLNGVLSFPAGKVVREVHLLNPFTEKTFAEEKVSVLDVKTRDQANRQFNLEMQLHS